MRHREYTVPEVRERVWEIWDCGLSFDGKKMETRKWVEPLRRGNRKFHFGASLSRCFLKSRNLAESDVRCCAPGTGILGVAITNSKFPSIMSDSHLKLLTCRYQDAQESSDLCFIVLS